MHPSFKCLCCLDSGLLNNFILGSHLGLENSTAPMAYACTRCHAAYENFGKDAFSGLKKISLEECDAIQSLEIERRREADETKTICRLTAKIKVAAYLKQPSLRYAAIAEAEARNIPLEQIGIVDDQAVAA
jgi:hypothetical protein